MSVNVDGAIKKALLIKSLIGNKDSDVIAVSVGTNWSYVQISNLAFLERFEEFNMKLVETADTYYRMYVTIQNVEIIAAIWMKDIVDLKTRMPNQWKYIQDKIQMEAVCP